MKNYILSVFGFTMLALMSSVNIYKFNFMNS